ncbi:flagellar protein FlaG [Caldibacillus debilis]|uniref:Flagellar biosynthesis protein FlaG n=1 Tax=Caldibacillus debilis TaxID=301148 RepID=A0A150M476_9BACI|nr:flagellar protein FlaG [Caldibacillus debilis]KYD19323.1 hypothetical protein B4135_2054 [Caldibacillus debilis]
MINRVSSSYSLAAHNRPHHFQNGVEIKVTGTRERNEENLTGDVLPKTEPAELVDNLNRFLRPTFVSIQFELHEKLNEYYVKIVDSETGEVIKEIPPKKLLDIYAALVEQLGLIIDEKI